MSRPADDAVRNGLAPGSRGPVAVALAERGVRMAPRRSPCARACTCRPWSRDEGLRQAPAFARPHERLEPREAYSGRGALRVWNATPRLQPCLRGAPHLARVRLLPTSDASAAGARAGAPTRASCRVALERHVGPGWSVRSVRILSAVLRLVPRESSSTARVPTMRPRGWSRLRSSLARASRKGGVPARRAEGPRLVCRVPPPDRRARDDRSPRIGPDSGCGRVATGRRSKDRRRRRAASSACRPRRRTCRRSRCRRCTRPVR